MQREILFRGQRDIDKQWVFGHYLFDIARNRHTIVQLSDNMFFKVIPETVGQFTGFTDINGVKIFNGDKLGVGIVVYDEYYCAFMIDFPHRSKKMYFENIVRMEVTGSIYDNSEFSQ